MTKSKGKNRIRTLSSDGEPRGEPVSMLCNGSGGLGRQVMRHVLGLDRRIVGGEDPQQNLIVPMFPGAQLQLLADHPDPLRARNEIHRAHGPRRTVRGDQQDLAPIYQSRVRTHHRVAHAVAVRSRLIDGLFPGLRIAVVDEIVGSEFEILVNWQPPQQRPHPTGARCRGYPYERPDRWARWGAPQTRFRSSASPARKPSAWREYASR